MIQITVIEPHVEIITPEDVIKAQLKVVEAACRTCYKSKHRMHDNSAGPGPFIRNIVKSGHESVIEHGVITARLVGSRAMSHQLVRHRLAAYSQESQRYCDYSKDLEADGGLKVICPPRIGVPSASYRFKGRLYVDFFNGGWEIATEKTLNSSGPSQFDMQSIWLRQILDCYGSYLYLWEQGIPPEDARFVLPNATKTEVVTTYNWRTWRWVFQQRAQQRAQWEIKGLMSKLLAEFARLIPEVFEELLVLEE